MCEPGLWKCNLVLHTHTHKQLGVETDVVNGQVVICNLLTSPHRSLSPSLPFCDIFPLTLWLFKVINVPILSAALLVTFRVICSFLSLILLAFFSVNKDLCVCSSGRLSAIDLLASLFAIHSERWDPRCLMSTEERGQGEGFCPAFCKISLAKSDVSDTAL